MSKQPPERKIYVSLFSIFFPASPVIDEDKHIKNEIIKDLKLEITQLATITNTFDEVQLYFSREALEVIQGVDFSSLHEVKARFHQLDHYYQACQHANHFLFDLVNDLIELFMSDELSFDDKCIAAQATAESAKKVLENLQPPPITLAGNRIHSKQRDALEFLHQTIDNITSLSAQGHALSIKPSLPVKPFSGPSFTL